MKERYTGGRLLSLTRSRGASFSAAVSNAKPAAACAASAHAPALAVSGKEAQYSSLPRAHLAALVAVCVGAIKEHCTGGRRLSFDTRPWCGVSGAASNAKPAAACAASAQALLLAFSREEAQHSSLLRARRATLVVVRLGRIRQCCPGGRLLSFGTRPWCDVPAAASNAKPAAA